MHVFTDGTNPIRIALFALYLLALFTMARLSKKGEPNEKKRTLQALVVGSVLILFTAGLLGHLWIYNAHDIPQRSLAVFLEKDEITNTRLIHTHTGKSAIATLVAPLFSYLNLSADTGASIASSLSPQFSIISALLFVVAIAASLVLGPHVIRQVSGKGKRLAAFILYGLVAFVVLEKSVDGGILNDGAVVALAAYFAIIVLPVRHFLRALLCGALFSTVLTSILFATGQYWGGERYFIGAVANALVLFFVLLAFHSARTEGWGSRRSLAVLLVALAALGTKAYADTAFKVAYLSTPAGPDSSYVGTYTLEDNVNTISVGSIGRLQVHSVSRETTMTVGELIDVLGAPYWYQPVSLYEGSCAKPATRIVATFVVHVPEAPKELSAIAEQLASLTLTPQGTDGAGWSTYAGSLSVHPCVPRRWDVLREMMRLVGIERSIVHGFSLKYVPSQSALEGMWTSQRGDTAPID